MIVNLLQLQSKGVGCRIPAPLFYTFGQIKLIMVKFDELRISEDGQCLTVECHVENYDIYSEMYIESIYLEYYKDRGASPDKKLLLFENHNQNPADVRAVRKRITVNEIPGGFAGGKFAGNMFYVYVTCNGPSRAFAMLEEMGMNCSFQQNVDIGVIVDWKALYRKIMPLVASFASNCSGCELPSDFEHMILLWNAFRFAIDTCDWVTAERIWDELMGLESAGAHGGSGCGCFNH